jgi:hypothetical protein
MTMVIRIRSTIDTGPDKVTVRRKLTIEDRTGGWWAVAAELRGFYPPEPIRKRAFDA